MLVNHGGRHKTPRGDCSELTASQQKDMWLDAEDYKKLVMRRQAIKAELQRRGLKSPAELDKSEF